MTTSTKKLAYTEKQRNKLWRKAPKFFIFREDFLDITTIEGAVVIQKLINFARWKMAQKEKKGKKFDGWFLYTMDLFFKHLRVQPKKTQRRLLNILIDAGFLFMRRRGTPPRRWLWIDVDAIDKARKRALKGPERGPSSKGPERDPIRKGPKRGPINSNNQEKIGPSRPASGAGGENGHLLNGHASQEVSSVVEAFYSRLLKSNKLSLNCRPSKKHSAKATIARWTKEAVELCVKHVVPFKQFRKRLKAVTDHVGTPWWPEVCSVKGLFDKWVAVGNAMERLDSTWIDDNGKEHRVDKNADKFVI